MKRMVMFAVLVAAVAALAAPAAASAGWSHNGAPLAENATVQLHGTIEIGSEVGGVHCEEMTAEVLLTAGTNVGDVETLTADNPSGCIVSGLLALICGANSLTSLHAEGALATIEGETIGLSELQINAEFGSCLTLLFEGSLIATPDDAEALSSVSLSGELESAVGSVAVGGALTVTPKGAYGISNGTAESEFRGGEEEKGPPVATGVVNGGPFGIRLNNPTPNDRILEPEEFNPLGIVKTIGGECKKAPANGNCVRQVECIKKGVTIWSQKVQGGGMYVIKIECD